MRGIKIKDLPPEVQKQIRREKPKAFKAGWREIGGQRIYCRSRWESNYARFLEWQKQRGDIVSWEHEPETFWFKGIKRGVCSYLPDFKVITHQTPEGFCRIEFHEVKGWMDPKSKTKIKRMAKYYSHINLVVIDAVAYRKLASTVAKIVHGWES